MFSAVVLLFFILGLCSLQCLSFRIQKKIYPVNKLPDRFEGLLYSKPHIEPYFEL